MGCDVAAVIPYFVHFGTAVLALLFSVLIFKIFPKSETSISGPLGTTFGELKFKAGGAIGGFLVVYIIMVVLTPNINSALVSEACGNKMEKWTFSVPVYILDGNTGQLDTDISKLKKQIKVELTESIWSISQSNQVKFHYYVNPDKITASLKGLSMDIANEISADKKNKYIYEGGNIDFFDKESMFIIDKENKRVLVGSPIIFKKIATANREFSPQEQDNTVEDAFNEAPELPMIPARN